MSETLILGAGISGLTAGWALRKSGAAPRLLEAGATPGGMVRTFEKGGFRFELGPHAIRSSPELVELVAAADLTDDVVAASEKLGKGYVVQKGRLVAVPTSVREAWSSPLISKKGLLCALSEPIRRRGPGPHESVTRFVERRLGKAAARLADALVLGLFAGDPDELAMAYAFPRIYRLEADHGGVLRGAKALRRESREKAVRDLPPWCSFPSGLTQLVERLASELDIDYGHEVEEVAALKSGGFEVRGRTPDGDFARRAERLICALPIGAAARALSALGDTAPFERIPHAPVAVVSLGYRRDQVRHPLDGFGFLAPHSEDRMLLGCLFSSTLFEDRAPEGHVALTVLAGGRRRREMLELSDEDLAERVLYDLDHLIGIDGKPVLCQVKRWVPGIPQATANLAGVRGTVEAMESAHPGLRVLGGWLHGVVVPACIRSGWNAGGLNGR